MALPTIHTGASAETCLGFLSDIPLELWHRVFDFACNDDGSTCISLSKTSRFFRNASQLHRYQSISITSHRQMIKFEKTFAAAPEELQKIYTLHVELPDAWRIMYPGSVTDAEAEFKIH